MNFVCRVVLHRRREGLPTKRRTAGSRIHQGVVHTSLRLQSRIYNNSLVERSLFLRVELLSFETTQTPSDVKARSFGFMKTSQSIHQYAPAKIFGGLNWCPSIHYRENLDSLRPWLGLRSHIVERNKRHIPLFLPLMQANVQHFNLIV